MSAQTMHFVSPAQFRDRVSEALADDGLRDNFRSAMQFLRDKRASQFPDPVETEALRDLARWLYRQLEAEYDHLTSDEAIEEGIIVNEYTFTEAGRRFG